MNIPHPETRSLLEYRMKAVAIGHLAVRYSTSWEAPPSITISFDGKLVIEGKATTFTNGAIEAAIVHARALLEFVGLGGKSETTLRERATRAKGDDIGIEHFPGLTLISIEQAVRTYPGPKGEAEAALAYVIHLANKGLAHTTTSFTKHDRGSEFLEIAFRGVPIIILNHFYAPLGLPKPAYELQSRK